MAQVRWPHGLACLGCGSVRVYPVKKRHAYKCGDCGQWVYLTSGTVMERSKTPFSAWFLGAWFMVRHTPGISAMQFQREAGINRYETAFNVLHKLRSALRPSDWPKLSGRTEADETFIGGARPGKRGRGAWGKSLVVGAAQLYGDAVQAIRLRVVKTAGSANLKDYFDCQCKKIYKRSLYSFNVIGAQERPELGVIAIKCSHHCLGELEDKVHEVVVDGKTGKAVWVNEERKGA